MYNDKCRDYHINNCKTSKFDAGFSRKYKNLKAQEQEIISKIDELIKCDIVGSNYMEHLINLLQSKQYEIADLLNHNTFKKFTKYTEKLFDTSLKIISYDDKLLERALRFDKITELQKENFGQFFLDKICACYHCEYTHFKFGLTTDQDAEAQYDPITHVITMHSDKIPSNLQDFIGTTLHEFTHHIYCVRPEIAPLGVQKTFAINQNLRDGSEQNITPSRLKPSESGAYFVNDYFTNHPFTQHLVQASKQK